MVPKEILRRLDIERKLRSNTVEGYSLRGGISNYEVTLDKSLKTKERAERLGVSRTTVQRQCAALRSNGLTREEAMKYKEKFDL